MNQFGTDTFIKFKNNISDKGFADNDICITRRDISCFNTSDEIDTFYFFKQWECFFDQCVSLFFFSSVIYNSNTRILDTNYMFHIDGSHFCKLHQM